MIDDFPKEKPLQKFYTLHSKTRQKKNIPETKKPSGFFWVEPSRKTPTHSLQTRKKTGDPGNQPYQPWESTLPTLKINLTNLRITLTNPGKPVFFGWLFCWPPVDSNPRERPRAKMLGQGPDGTKALSNKTKGGPVDLLEMEPSKFPLKKIKEYQRCCFTFYFYLVHDMVFQNMFHFVEIFQKSICLCSSGNLSDVFVGHRIRRFFFTLGVLPSGKPT